jgi:hypothetical protein
MALMVVDEKILNYQIDNIKDSMKIVVGKIFRLLPTYEEGKDWSKPLETLIIELTGMTLIQPDIPLLYQLLYKLQGLKQEGENMELMSFRRVVFEACNIANRIQESL